MDRIELEIDDAQKDSSGFEWKRAGSFPQELFAETFVPENLPVSDLFRKGSSGRYLNVKNAAVARRLPYVDTCTGKH
ncbi:hypothetical protein XAC1083_770015 [Xanthomonas citri pv. citri]|nr:hypothetical protein XAC1083_770015 [Xanthomonas citri pv. citri]